ncbi:MAG TPA: hypothetical protein VG939_12705 [Caulobacteraceae bacterium]|nr:hypothetical protein [Caulobacteraceae bacterium]
MRRAEPFDVFAGVNLALCAVLGAAFVAHRGLVADRVNVAEFLVYGAAIALVAALGWRSARRAHPTWLVLAVMQGGILAHLAGGLVWIHGVRLYDVDFGPVGYDKIVHAANAAAGAMLADSLIRGEPRPVPKWVVVTLVVMGAGSLVEMVEYLAQRVIPNTGVGGYDNNSQDLFANTAGALLFAMLHGARRALAAHRAAP